MKYQLDSPAEKAGLKKNDIIIGIDNNKVESILEVSMFINTLHPIKLNIKVLRKEENYTYYRNQILLKQKMLLEIQ